MTTKKRYWDKTVGELVGEWMYHLFKFIIIVGPIALIILILSLITCTAQFDGYMCPAGEYEAAEPVTVSVQYRLLNKLLFFFNINADVTVDKAEYGVSGRCSTADGIHSALVLLPHTNADDPILVPRSMSFNDDFSEFQFYDANTNTEVWRNRRIMPDEVRYYDTDKLLTVTAGDD